MGAQRESTLSEPEQALLAARKWSAYDRVIVAFSGGKDSLACVLRLIDMGVPRDRIELWHHDVDGAHGGAEPLMDWPVTTAYCKAVAAALGVPLYLSWREGGIEREMLRDGTRTAPVVFEMPDGTRGRAGGTAGKLGVRRRFPQVAASLTTRWCSAVVKIDVARRVFANDPRFASGRFLFVTGERRQESSNRASYAETDLHCSSTRKRTIVQWRAVIDHTEADVWALIRQHGIRPHPAYQLGWGRVSCVACIFGDRDQWAGVQDLLPAVFTRIAEYEEAFGSTIQRKVSVRQQAAAGRSPCTDAPREVREQATTRRYALPVIQSASEWAMPAGAFKTCGGPS